MELKEVKIDIAEGENVIIGMSHFIKTVEDLYETLVESGAVDFGFAFCEASGPRLIRSDGTNEEMRKKAEQMALKIGAGHSFIIYLKKGYPINVLNRIKQVSEVVNLFAATANPLYVLVAENEQGRGIIGVIDGLKPLGIESDEDKQKRKDFLRKIGYKR